MSQPRSHSLIIGAGITGRSVVRHLHGRESLTLIDSRGAGAVCDLDQQRYPQLEVLAPTSAVAFERLLRGPLADIDRAIVSPGIRNDQWLLQVLTEYQVPLETDIDLFFQAVGHVPVIGITGTNGKSTVTAMTAALLQAAGINARAGGNLGPAALDLIDAAIQAYVLELSSFQLARSGELPFGIATILNLTDDHTDYHGSADAYGAAKQRIYRRSRKVLHNRADLATAPVGAVTATKIGSFGPDLPGVGDYGVADVGQRRLVYRDADRLRVLLACSELPLPGSHNEQNVLAAWALAAEIASELEPTVQIDTAFATASREFRGLPHRCEFVASIDGIQYLNDSKATNVGATLAAVRGLAETAAGELHLLLGGVGKGADFAPLATVLPGLVRHAYLFGEAAGELEDVLEGAVHWTRCPTLFDAIDRASQAARAGDLVLLSPACASFDQFRSFEDRGDQFRAYVQGLER